jgi:hypothetical protein
VTLTATIDAAEQVAIDATGNVEDSRAGDRRRRGDASATGGAEDASCDRWAVAGECSKNSRYMLSNCASACAEWEAAGEQPGPASKRASQQEMISASTSGPCVDMLVDCAELARPNLTACAENASHLLTQCPKTCGACAYRSLVAKSQECVDQDPGCANWASLGECHNNPRSPTRPEPSWRSQLVCRHKLTARPACSRLGPFTGFMLQSCAVACGTCEAKQTGCDRTETAPTLQAGDALDAMFRRALSEFPEHSPTALSTDPWVLQFENMVSAEDAAALVGACTKFERSLAGDHSIA